MQLKRVGDDLINFDTLSKQNNHSHTHIHTECRPMVQVKCENNSDLIMQAKRASKSEVWGWVWNRSGLRRRRRWRLQQSEMAANCFSIGTSRVNKRRCRDGCETTKCDVNIVTGSNLDYANFDYANFDANESTMEQTKHSKVAQTVITSTATRRVRLERANEWVCERVGESVNGWMGEWMNEWVNKRTQQDKMMGKFEKIKERLGN